MTPSEETQLCEEQHVASVGGVTDHYFCNRLKGHDGNHYFVVINSGS